jgi:predicted nucleotidyltransferase
MSLAIDIDREKIAAFCRKWRITEFSLFGSVLRDDFRPDSDVDVMVSFDPQARWTLLDLAEMQEQLQVMLGRNVDLLTRRGVEQARNPLRRTEILSSAEIIYGS